MVHRMMTLVLVLMGFGPLCHAQEVEPCVLVHPVVADVKFSGNALVDLIGERELGNGPVFMQDGTLNGAITRKKSPWLAAGLSLVLPGAGEFYAESYLKSVLFVAADIALWGIAYAYDRKGNRQTDFFQGFADQHWSVWRYADFTQKKFNFPAGRYQWEILPDGPQPWLRVNWAELNRMERDIGGYYSHTLPLYGEQQYYELIGKYPQFNQGWDDAPSSFNYGEPLTARFLYYADERGKANSYYETASTMVTIAIANHVVSALDAAFTAGSYNSGLHADIGLLTIPTDAGPKQVPALTMKFGL